MGSVTKRIGEVKQPRGGYVKIADFEVRSFKDGKELHSVENIHATLVGLAVDYLTRIELGEEKKTAFHVSLNGAIIAEKFGMNNAYEIAQNLLDGIYGIDSMSIVNACKLSAFDVWVRNTMGAIMARTYEDINPDEDTIENIQILISRSIAFLGLVGPVIKRGFSFEPVNANPEEYVKMKETGKGVYGGYTPTVTTGDGDFLTKDTLWDFKVLSKRPKSQHVLQLLMYWVMGQHSGQECFKSVNKIGLFNPRLNVEYLLDTTKISDKVIQIIEKDIIRYPDNEKEEATKYAELAHNNIDLRIIKEMTKSIDLTYGDKGYREIKSFLETNVYEGYKLTFINISENNSVQVDCLFEDISSAIIYVALKEDDYPAWIGINEILQTYVVGLKFTRHIIKTPGIYKYTEGKLNEVT